MRPATNKYLLLVVLGLITLGADQLTKYLAVSRLTTTLQAHEGTGRRVRAFFGERRPEGALRSPGDTTFDVLPNYWSFRYVENPGAAWGLLSDLPRRVREPLFHVVSLVALGFIGWMFRRVEPSQRLLQVSLSLVLGGAVGNFLDRVLRGYVIDFIDWHWRNQPNLRWPTFNVADAAICVGVTLMLLDSLRARGVSGAPVLDAGPRLNDAT